MSRHTSDVRICRDLARIWADSAHQRWSGLSLQCMTTSGEEYPNDNVRQNKEDKDACQTAP
jgi:hypothetical protein